MNRVLIYTFLLGLLFSASCISDDSDNIDSLFASTKNLEAPASPYPKKVLGTEDFEKTIDGIKYQCKRTKYSFCQNFDEFIGSNPNSQALYPGSIVKGGDVRNGTLTSIGSIDRAEMKYTLVGDNTMTAKPTLEGATQVVNNLIDNSQKAPNAQISYSYKRVHSVEQGLVELGLDFKILKTGVQTELSTGFSEEHSYVYVLFKQAYDEVVVEYPGSASGFFSMTVMADDLRSQMSDESPLCYISSVTYGRAFIAEFKSTSSKKDLEAAVGLSYGIADFNSGYTSNSILEQSEVKVMILGGSAQDASKAASIRTPKALHDLIVAGANPDRSVRVYPIGYQVRHLSDNSLVKIGNPIEYTAEECDLDPSNVVTLELKNLGFNIIEDCDFWGPGDFYYYIDVLDENGKSLLNAPIESSQVDTIEKSDGEYLGISETRRFSVLKTSGFFEVSGFLKQQLSNNSFELVGNISRQFYAPYSNLTTSPITLQSDSDCEAEFLYRLVKI